MSRSSQSAAVIVAIVVVLAVMRVPAVLVRLELLGHESRQVRLREREHEDLIRVVDARRVDACATVAGRLRLPLAAPMQPRSRVFRAVSLVVGFLAFSQAAPARAFDWHIEDTRPALRASVGVDVFRVPGTWVASARYGGSWNVKAATWLHNAGVDPSAPHLLFGGGYVLTMSRFRFGAGLVWIDKINNNVNGTHLNVDASVAYDLSDRIFVEYQHYSHGAIVGVQQNVSNGGWNLVGLGVIF